MSTTRVVKPKVLSQILFDEVLRERAYCRKVETVLDGQVLKLGQVVKLNSASKVVAFSGTTNEKHKFTFTGAPSASGTVTLTLYTSDGLWVKTAPIQVYGATATDANVAAAVNAVLGTSAVSASCTGSGTAITDIELTFSGTGYAGKTQPQGSVDWSYAPGITACTFSRSTPAGTAQDAVQSFTITGTLTSGTVKIGIPVNGAHEWTPAITYNATLATFITAINSALDTLFGSSQIVASAADTTLADGILLTYSGSLFDDTDQPLAAVDCGLLGGATGSPVTHITRGGKIGVDAYGIALAPASPSGEDGTTVCLVRGPATVNRDELEYGGADPDTVETALKALGIVMLSQSALRSIV